MQQIKLISLLFCLVISTYVFAKNPDKSPELLQKGIKFNLDKDGKSYTKLSFGTQFWMRNTWLNNQQQGASGEYFDSEFDFALRRTRFSMLNNLNDKVVLYTQLGFNNLNKNSDKPDLYFHDVFGLLQIMPKAVYFGFGLHGWNGISRLTNTSYQKTLTLDNPGFNIPTVNHTDIEIRQLGVFVKGTAGRFSYRAALSKPFEYSHIPENITANSSYEISNENLNYKGYVAYHFFDKEYYTTPYVSMTYLGKKKLLNLGMGFDYYPESIIEVDANSNEKIKDRVLLGTDIFCELPFAKKQAVTLYSVFYNYNFGTNYLRQWGTMNIWNGSGNSEYKIGTGNVFYTSLGYLFRENFVKLSGRLQLFYAYSLKDFEALPVNLTNHDMGANYYVAGQKLKFTIQYSTRSIIDEQSTSNKTHRGTLLFQTQIII